MLRHTAPAVTLLFLLASGLACTPYITVQSRRPGPVNVGGTNSLVILDGEGRRSAKEYVQQELERMARADGYFRVENKVESGVTIALAGVNATVENESEPLVDGGAYLKIDVLDWTADKATETVTNKDGSSSTVTTQTGRAVLGMTLVDKDGKAIVAERDYEGVASSTNSNVSRDQVIEMAAVDAIRRFLHDVTPVAVATRVRVDDSDEGQKTILETAEKGNFQQAVQDLEAYIGKNPNSPAAFYNMAVFLDAMGYYEDALSNYDKAIELSGGSKGFYSTSRAECAKRKANAEALSS